MKKSTKAIILTAVTMTLSSLTSCQEPVGVYGPGPDIDDPTNDVSKSVVLQVQNNQMDRNFKG